MADQKPISSTLKSKSPSVSPSSKDKEASSAVQATVATVAQPGTAGPPGGPHSYYRQHTMNGGMYDAPHPIPLHSYPPVFVPPPPGMMMDGQYPQGIGLPTSATRLHQASWPPPPWATDGTQPPMAPMPYHPAAGPYPPYYHSPYYRPAMMPPHPPPPHQPQINPELVAQSQAATASPAPQAQSGHPSRKGTPATSDGADARSSQGKTTSQQVNDGSTTESAKQPDGETKSTPTAPVIDPSLDMSSADQASDQTMSSAQPVSLEITQAAMQAVLESAQRESGIATAQHKALGTPEDKSVSQDEDETEAELMMQEEEQDIPDTDHDMDEDGRGNNPDGSGTPSTQRAPAATDADTSKNDSEVMDQMLTEDGEPMLNPGTKICISLL